MRIPITWRLDDGTPTADTVRGRPCISIGYTPQVDKVDGFLDGRLVVPLTAMIDTGATYNVVDSTICATACFERHVTANGFLSSGLAEVRRGTLLFNGTDGEVLSCSEEFASSPIVGEPYQAVIGRGFLSICELVYDGPNKCATLIIKAGRRTD